MAITNIHDKIFKYNMLATTRYKGDVTFRMVALGELYTDHELSILLRRYSSLW